MTAVMLRKLLTRGTAVASLTESSRALASAACRAVDPSRPQVVVELGAGTGPITEVAAARMHPDSRLVAIEIDPELAEIAKRRVPRAEVRVGDCRDVAALTADLDHVDVVLSGLPVPSLPPAVTEPLWVWLASHAGASFHQLTVMPWVYQALYRARFRDVRFELVVQNLPPGGIYHCAHVAC